MPLSFIASFATSKEDYGLTPLLAKNKPIKKVIAKTAKPVERFIATISEGVIPSKLTSIDRCNAKIETNPSTSNMLRREIALCDRVLLDLIRLTVAKVILVKASTAIANIGTILNLCPRSVTTDKITTPESGTDKNISIHPVGRATPCFPSFPTISAISSDPRTQ